jgi:hypothetical protein
MNGFRRIVLTWLALAFAAFALPAAAADKLFSISAKTYTTPTTTTPASSLGGIIPTGATPTIVLIDFFNQTPTQANSVIKSAQVTLPTDVSYTKYAVTSTNSGACAAPTAGLSYTNGSSKPLVLTGLNGIKPSGHLCVYFSATTSATSCQPPVDWTGQANTGTNFGNGTPFTIDGTNPLSKAQTVDGCTGVMGCDTGTTSGKNNVWGTLGGQVFTDSAFVGSADWGLVRGPNTAGDCAPVAFQFTLDPGVASFIVSDAAKGSQGVAVEYVIVWPSLATVDGWTEARPQLAWGVPGNLQPPAAAFVPALACLEDPADPTGLTMAIMPVIPTTSPAKDPFQAAVELGYTQYTPGTQVKVCVSQHGWTSNGSKVQYWDKIIDLADAWVLPNKSQ